MSDEIILSEWIANAVILGIGATMVMDLWAVLLQRVFGITSLDYALVGRWLAYLSKGIAYHDNINLVKPIAAETVLGWVAHYMIGAIFAAVLVIFAGSSWLINPSIVPALVFGALTVAFPYFVMQPCLGLGVAAAKTPQPNVARFRSLLTHITFGLGLYLSAIVNVLIFGNK